MKNPTFSYDGQGVIMAGAPGKKEVVCVLEPSFRELAPLFVAASELLDLVQRAMLNMHNDAILLRRAGLTDRDEKETQWWKDAVAALTIAKEGV